MINGNADEERIASGATEKQRSDKGTRVNRRTIIRALSGGVAAAVGGFFFARQKNGSKAPRKDPTEEPQRLVSLSPGVTDTIIALGRGERLVGVSDYCDLPAGLSAPRVGTAITPHFEKIAMSSPDLIILSKVAGESTSPLSKLAPLLSLPWLTLGECLDSISLLGAQIGRSSQASALIEKLSRALEPKQALDAPRVLLALEYGGTGDNDTWFIRRNSFHGAALEAAGANNAIARDVTGQPKLSPEALLALDPDGIIIVRAKSPDASLEAQAKAHFEKWAPLTAVKEGRVAVISLPKILTIGPGILDLIPELQRPIALLFPRKDMKEPAEDHEE